jgi:hypothetical protein
MVTPLKDTPPPPLGVGLSYRMKHIHNLPLERDVNERLAPCTPEVTYNSAIFQLQVMRTNLQTINHVNVVIKMSLGRVYGWKF